MGWPVVLSVPGLAIRTFPAVGFISIGTSLFRKYGGGHGSDT